jgi:hypothetical protein
MSGVLWLLSSCSLEAASLALVLLRWEPDAAVEACQRSSVNKLGAWPSDFDPEAVAGEEKVGLAVLPICCSHQGDGGGDWKRAVRLASSWWGFAAAICGVPQRRRAGAAVILGQGDHSALRSCGNRGFFNLQADVPSRRPFHGSVTAFFVTPPPSGLVPGVGVDGREVEFVKLRWRRLEGLDCFFSFCSRVLCVKMEVVLALFLLVWTSMQFVIPPL